MRGGTPNIIGGDVPVLMPHSVSGWHLPSITLLQVEVVGVFTAGFSELYLQDAKILQTTSRSRFCSIRFGVDV